MFLNANKIKERKLKQAERFFQKTLRNPISCAGVGLHSGKRIYMTIKPASPNTGIIFRKVDSIEKDTVISAHISNVSDTQLCSCVGDNNGAKIATIEHLMAAFHALGVDNAEVEINGSEVPAMDGSSSSFVFLIECAGIVKQEAPKYAVRVLKEVSLTEGMAKVSLSPTSGSDLRIDFEIDFKDNVVGHQYKSFKVSDKAFKKEISKARTFGFINDYEKLKAMGFAKGGSLENAVVIDEDKILNEDGLRYGDEFVRHKILDAVGDLYLSGYTIVGNYKASCSGHAHTYKLLKKLFSDKSAYEIIRLEDLKVSTEKKLFDIKESLLATA